MHNTVLTEEAIEVVRTSAQEVLETMFFAIVEEDETDNPQWKPSTADPISARVEFDGTWQGYIEITLSRDATEDICRDFLGLDFDEEVDELQRGHVIGEMANMICGRALSHLEPNGTFHLSTPRVTAAAAAEPPPGSIRAELPLETGPVAVLLSTT